MANKVPSIPIDAPGFKGKVLSRLFVDGQPLEDLQALYTLNTQALGATKWNAPNRFWATPERHSQSPIRDVLEVSLAGPQRINQFSFQAANFPCRIWLQYWHPTKKEWRPVKTKKRNKPVQITITKSVPRRIHADVFDKSHRHHQHRGAGHWENFRFSTRTIKSAKIRLIFAHLPSHRAPKDRRNKPVAYSLAIQDFQFGYRVREWKDVPRITAPTQSEVDFTAFSSSTDLLGSPVEFGMRLYRASDLVWPMREAEAGMAPAQRQHDGDVWKSEPQPYPYCVVNLYVDARNETGEPQVIDRFHVDPTTNGVTANLYYSNDVPDYYNVEAADDEIRYPGIQATGRVGKDENGLMLPDAAMLVPGADPGQAVGYLDLGRQMVQWMFDQPWWVGITLTPQFGSDDPNVYVILDSPGLTLSWQGELGFRARVHNTDMVVTFPAFQPGTRLSMIIAYDDHQVRTVTLPQNETFGVTVPLTEKDMLNQVGGDRALNSVIRFGAARVPATPGVPGYANVRLHNFVLKREQYLPGVVTYLIDPEPYLIKPEDEDEDAYDYTANATLRVHPSFQTTNIDAVTQQDVSANPYGFVGGPGNIYENLVWTPINRDFKLHRGTLQFDAVRAKYFKFEFTNLVAKPYSSYEPVKRRIRVFSASARQRYRNWMAARGGDTSASIGGSGADVNKDLARVRKFSDQNRNEPPSNPYPDYGPTEALYSSDPATQERLGRVNPLFGLQPWHQSVMAPRHNQAQRHVYEIIEVEHTSKTAFFVGLKGLRMSKVNYAVADDTKAYLFLFQDDTNLSETEPFPWSLDPDGGLYSPGTLPSTYVLTTSETLASRRTVRGIQFATMQTPAHQRLIDPDFDDTSLQHWKAYAGAVIESSSDLNSDIGNTIKVSRNISGAYWNYLETFFRTTDVPYSTWDAIEDSDPDPGHPTWNQMEDTENTVDRSQGGVESTERLSMPVRGRMYAAARVYAPETLHGPLHLQIVGEREDGITEVLSSTDTIASPGAVVEWYTSYTVGEGGAGPGEETYGRIMSRPGNEVTAPVDFECGDNDVSTSRTPVFEVGQAHGDYGQTIIDDAINTLPYPTDGSETLPSDSTITSQRGFVTYTSDYPVNVSIQSGDTGALSFLDGPAGTEVTLTSEIILDDFLQSALLFITGTSGAPETYSVQVHEWGVETDYSRIAPGPRPWDAVEALGTWDDVEDFGTWNDVQSVAGSTEGFEGFSGKVYPRLVQDGATTDVFYVDNIAIYEDPIIWEFSNNSGVTWYPVYDIRNNPDGVFLFPEEVTETADSQEDSRLCWRVWGYRPNLHISGLLIRPWYSSLILGVAPRMGMEWGGPNQTPYDQYPAIHDAPPFKQWSKPIPEDWWFAYRQWLLAQYDLTVPGYITAPEAIDGIDETIPASVPALILCDELIYERLGTAHIVDVLITP